MLDQLIKTIILGLIQGLAEWLPISSTAHLKIAEHFLGLTTTPFFNLILHLGTLIVVVFYFRKDVYNILKALARLDFKSEYGIMIPLIIAATIPTAIIGLIYVETLENTLSNSSLQLLAIGITFLIGASYLFISKIGKEKLQTISYRTAMIMGIAQGLAIFPGLSRSGATISTAILLGLKRDQAFKFSFLLSIPAIIGDAAVEAFHDRGQLAAAASSINTIDVLIAIVIAMVAGYVAIRIVSKAVRSKKFHYFALYTFSLGIALIILTLSGY